MLGKITAFAVLTVENTVFAWKICRHTQVNQPWFHSILFFQVRCLPQVWRSVLTAPFKSGRRSHTPGRNTDRYA